MEWNDQVFYQILALGRGSQGYNFEDTPERENLQFFFPEFCYILSEQGEDGEHHLPFWEIDSISYQIVTESGEVEKFTHEFETLIPIEYTEDFCIEIRHKKLLIAQPAKQILPDFPEIKTGKLIQFIA